VQLHARVAKLPLSPWYRSSCPNPTAPLTGAPELRGAPARRLPRAWQRDLNIEDVFCVGMRQRQQTTRKAKKCPKIGSDGWDLPAVDTSCTTSPCNNADSSPVGS
jgi:hypothetical protein